MNNVVLVGRLARDPELRYIPEYGTPVATFALAVDRGYTKRMELEKSILYQLKLWEDPQNFVLIISQKEEWFQFKAK